MLVTSRPRVHHECAQEERTDRFPAARPFLSGTNYYQTSFNPSCICRDDVDVIPNTPALGASNDWLASFKKY